MNREVQASFTKQLYKSADILRGYISDEDILETLLPLLFVKWVFDRAAVGVQTSVALRDARNWDEYVRVLYTEDPHEVLAESFSEIERLEDNFEELFTFLGVPSIDTTALRRIVEQLFGPNLFKFPKELSSALDDLIHRLSMATGKRKAEHTTPRSIARLMAELLSPPSGATLYDPACGLAGLLNAAREDQTTSVYGQEINQTVCALGKIRLYLSGVMDHDIRAGNSLADPAFTERDELSRFDHILSQPPFGVAWDAQAAMRDHYERFPFGIPSKNAADSAFIQHSLASLKPDGRAVILTLTGVLFRGGLEREVRQNLIESDCLEAVIETAPNLFYNATLSAVLLVFNKAKRDDHKDHVLFIDASSLIDDSQRFNTLSSEHIQRIAQTYRAFQAEEGFSHVASLAEIASNDFNLSIARYVKPSPPKAKPIEETLMRLNILEIEAQRADAQFKSALEAWTTQ